MHRALACLLAVLAVLLTAGPAMAAAPPGSSPLGDALDLLEAVSDLYGTPYPAVIRSLGVSIDVVPLPQAFLGGYQQRARRVVLNSRLLDEDAAVIATVIAHEVTHAQDHDLIGLGLLDAGCADMEVRAYQAQARTWRALWTDELSTATRIEQDMTRVTRRYEAEGVDGLRAMVLATPYYQRECGARDPA